MPFVSWAGTGMAIPEKRRKEQQSSTHVTLALLSLSSHSPFSARLEVGAGAKPSGRESRAGPRMTPSWVVDI